MRRPDGSEATARQQSAKAKPPARVSQKEEQLERPKFSPRLRLRLPSKLMELAPHRLILRLFEIFVAAFLTEFSAYNEGLWD